MVPPVEYQRLIGEAVEDFSYMKFPYYKPQGYPKGIYRVGPLARLNNAVACGTPYADVALAEFRMLQESGPIASSFHYHYARLVEIIYAIEMMERLLKDPEILDHRVRARARSNRDEGIGVSEAPRGTLMHHYRIDDDGLITWVNLIIATGHNNLAMNQSIRQVADAYVDGNNLQEGMLNRVEAVIRCYDPCLSCASHAFGQMPLCRRAVFLDAAVDAAPGEVRSRRIAADPTAMSTMAHFHDPRELLAWCEALYGESPEAWLVTAGGAIWDYSYNELSPAAAAAVEPMLAAVLRLVTDVSTIPPCP
jgi:coenzyme F420-reducing hydrogenase alpha subunit